LVCIQEVVAFLLEVVAFPQAEEAFHPVVVAFHLAVAYPVEVGVLLEEEL
jgi:hypothetical protein